jgi:prevent-host-death family protein
MCYNVYKVYKHLNISIEGDMKERQIGATELRQRLTDVIQAVKEEKVAYVVETFGRPQVVIVDVAEYERMQAYRARREQFFDRLTTVSEENARLNSELSEDQLLAIIDEARNEVYEESRS